MGICRHDCTESANPQTPNRYSYVLGNPLVYVDPTGHMHWPGDGGVLADPLSEERLALCEQYADQYGIPLDLLAGTIAVEVRFDTARHDPYVDRFMLESIVCAEHCTLPAGSIYRIGLFVWDYLLPRNSPGPGVAQFHTATARRAENYFLEQYGESSGMALPFSERGSYPQNSYRRIEYLVSDEGSIHYAAANLRRLADLRTGVGAVPNTQPHLGDLTYQDMTVINGAYWAGIKGGWGTIEEYQGAAIAGEKGLLILIYLGLYE